MRQRGNEAQSILAGGVVLGAFPLGLAVLFLTAGSDDGHSRAAGIFAEAGPWAYGVLGATLLASVFAALMVVFSGKQPALLPSAVMAFAFPLLVAVLGGELELRGMVDVVLRAAPADQLTIIAGSPGERIALTRLTDLVIGTAWILVALAALLTLGAGQLLPRLGVAGSAGLLGLSAFALAFRAIQVSSTLRAVAHVAPGDRARILGMGLIETEPTHVAGMALLAVGVLLAVAVGALAFRISPQLGVAMLVGCLGGAIALASLEVRSRHYSFFIPEFMGLEVAADLFEVTGPFADSGGSSLEPGDSGERIDEKVRAASVGWRNNELKRTCLFVNKTLERDQVVRFLQGARKSELAVDLVGRGRAKPVHAPSYARRFTQRLSESLQGVRIELRTTGEACDDCVGVAKVSGAKLEVTALTGRPAEKWDLAEDFEPAEKPLLLDFEWKGGVDELVRAGSVAFTHGHALSIALP